MVVFEVLDGVVNPLVMGLLVFVDEEHSSCVIWVLLSLVSPFFQWRPAWFSGTELQ